jgi:hypothetical protein
MINRVILFLIILSYLIKIIFVPLTSQNDLLLIFRRAYFISQGQWNIYEYMSQPGIYEKYTVSGHPPASYPYGVYLFAAAWLELLRLIGLVTYEGWTAVWGLPSRSLWFLLLKLPHVVADILIGSVLLRLFAPQRGLIAWALWSWSFTVAYLLFMGQYDLYPTLFVALAAYLGSCSIAIRRLGGNHRQADALSTGSMLALGVGATFKLFPFFLVPPFAILLAQRWRERALLFTIPITVFAVSALPFLSTPAFVSGVLFNFEGIRLFSAVQLFATPVSLFLVAYTVLLLVLIARPWRLVRPIDTWLAGAIVFSSFLLFSWSQFYWTVWLTPFAVALAAHDAGRSRYWLMLWLIIEVTSVIILFSRHRDFSIGLLAGTSLSFRFAQLNDVLALFAPALSQPIEILWTTARSAQTAARLLVFAGALVLLVAPKLTIWRRAMGERLPHIRPVQLGVLIMMPALVGLLAAVSVFAVSRHAVAREYSFNKAQRVVLTSEQPSLTQTFPPLTATLTGMLLNIVPNESSVLPSELQACVLVSGGEYCAQGRLMASSYGVRLPAQVALHNEPLTVVFRLAEPAADARVVVPVASLAPGPRTGDHRLFQAQSILTGHVVHITLLRSFSVVQALTEVSARLTQDWRLFVVWPLVAIVLIFSVSQTIRASFKKASSGSRVQNSPLPGQDGL